MMSDIFSIFDSYSYNFMTPSSTILISMNTLLLLTIQLTMWNNPTRKFNLLIPMKEFMMSQLWRTTATHLKGMSSIVMNLFIMIILMNLIGMVPYCIPSSSHLIMTLSIGLPMWMSMLLSSFSYAPKKSTAHFLPDGAPEWLNPFLVMIESSSIVVRPITLSFRLAANMTAGHIVLTLISMYAASTMFTSPPSFFMLELMGTGYVTFELVICLIQAYIFCLLLSLYTDDHAH